MNGLEEMYSSEIEFRRIDANSQEGKPVFQYYNLQGHPSYVLLNSAGEVLWQGLGEQTSEILKEKIINTLEQ